MKAIIGDKIVDLATINQESSEAIRLIVNEGNWTLEHITGSESGNWFELQTGGKNEFCKLRARLHITDELIKQAFPDQRYLPRSRYVTQLSTADIETFLVFLANNLQALGK